MIKTDKYLSVPYVDGGREIAVGVDCWGLVRHVLHYDFKLPLLEGFSGVCRALPDDMQQGFSEYKALFEECEPKAGAVACLFASGGVFHHVGVCIDDRDVLQTNSGSGVRLVSIRAFRRMSYTARFYEFVGKSNGR